MSKLFQIKEGDLADLERALPILTEHLRANTSNADRVKIRRVKEILSDVRWDYQPHGEITEIPAGDNHG